MSTTKTNKQTSNQSAPSKVESKSSTTTSTIVKPTYKQIEKAIIEIVKAGMDYKMSKTGTFMINWKRKVRQIRQADDPDEFIIENAKQLFPNESQYRQKKSDTKEWYKYKVRVCKAIIAYYNMNYIIAKEYFKTEEELEKEAEDFLNDETDEDESD